MLVNISMTLVHLWDIMFVVDKCSLLTCGLLAQFQKASFQWGSGAGLNPWNLYKHFRCSFLRDTHHYLVVVLTTESHICLKIQSISNAIKNIKNHFEKLTCDVFILWNCCFHLSLSVSDYPWKRQMHFLFLSFQSYFNVNY